MYVYTPPINPKPSFGTLYRRPKTQAKPQISVFPTIAHPSTTPYYTPQTEYAIHCRKCATPKIMSQTYLTHYAPPTHCPVHHTLVEITVADGWDYYAVHLNVPRALCIFMLNHTRNIFHKESLKYVKHAPKNPLTDEPYEVTYIPEYNSAFVKDTNAEWAHEIIQNMPTQAPVHINTYCTSCASLATFTMSPTSSLPTHCPYCATPTLTPLLTQPTFQTILAQVYGLDSIFVHALYLTWQAHYTNYASFACFMRALPDIFRRDLNQVHTEVHSA